MKTAFSTYSVGNWTENSVYGDEWRLEPSGDQVVGISNKSLLMTTGTAKNPNNTYAALVTSTPGFSDWTTLTVDFTTLNQLRTEPNEWEVAWVLFNYKNVNRFYSVALKTTGWEISKEWHDGVRQRQDFLAFEFNQGYPINTRYQLQITQTDLGPDGLRFDVSYKPNTGTWIYLGSGIDDNRRESGPAYVNGKVGLYAEDSKVRFYNVSIT